MIDVPKSLLQNIMPSGDDLKLIAHIRQAKDDKDQRIGDEFAVIIGDRLPTPRKQNTVYLISVENRYTDSGFDFSNMGNTIRLVTLKSWQFTCANDQETFEGLLQNLNSSPSTLRLPINSNADAEKYLSQGLVPLNYQQQQGNNSISWYHSPFITGENNHKFSLPVHTSEQLLATNPYNSLVDVSYAAAWELGRLLTLQSKKISVALYNWKSSHRQQLASQEDKILHLPPSSTQIDPSKTSDAAIVKQWFAELSVLKGVPFNYLVPDESMLPIESIRFFQVDSLWVDCLLDGAFSIGRVMKSDYNADQKLGTIQPKSLDTLTGFLLRSDLVSGWPNLQIEYTGTNCTLVRKDYLSSHILLCLFTGKIDSINIQQRPEGLFFGVEDDNGSYRKQIRNSDGSDSGNYVNISWQGDSGKRVIDFPALSTSLNVSNSADFAMQMIEGVGKRTFENNG